MQKIFFGIAIALFLNACFASKEIASPPKWFLSLPKNDVFLYGNGSGTTIEESKKNAINDLASNIKLKVRSDTDIQNIQNDNKQYSKMLQNIQVSIEAIELQNITFTHTDYKSKRYYSQIKISKNILEQTLKKDYQNLYTKISNLVLKDCKSISIKNKTFLDSLLKQANSLEQSIFALNPNASLQSLGTYENILAQNSPLPQARLVFSPHSDPEVIKALSSEYAKFIKNTDAKNIQTIHNTITIQSQANQVKISLQASINDCKKQTIFYIQIHSNEKNKNDAIERLKVQLYKKLKEYQGGDEIEIPKIF